jgi:glyoxylase-like metal-dependent hydrolase (beta-lactamase superfamily II)
LNEFNGKLKSYIKFYGSTTTKGITVVKMKVNNLTVLNGIYTSNVYLLTGDWNTMDDLNTLIDVGRDPAILKRIDNASTGVGKHRIEQVVLTHSHYDHASLLPVIKKMYNPKVFAFSSNLSYVDEHIYGGEKLKIADRQFEVIHAPGHSSDSICLYCEEEKALFAGDTPLVMITKDNSYDSKFIEVLEYIASKEIKIIYFGHGEPLKQNIKKTLLKSLKNAKS